MCLKMTSMPICGNNKNIFFMEDIITVTELMELCKRQIANGNGDKKIMISCDEEGNGYHGLYYDFTPATTIFPDVSKYDEYNVAYSDYDRPFEMRGKSLSEFIVLG